VLFVIKLYKSLDRHLQEVLGGAFSSLMIRVLGALLGFAVTLAVSEMLGADGAGVYFLALSIATVGATISRIGFDNTIVKFIAIASSEKSWNVVRGLNRRGVNNCHDRVAFRFLGAVYCF
jgi:O-antigen/teichoic acid export membrane protein